MTAVLCLTGGLLLVVCGAGVGFVLAQAEREKWRSAHAFSRLLQYAEDSIRYKGVPAEEVLRAAAAYPEFARLGLGSCSRFGELAVPQSFSDAMGRELRDNLFSLEACGRESACKTIEGMILLCRSREDILEQNAQNAMRLYPRLGGCIGALAAILLI